METSREARRRKILDRGTDRLAFITGQARSPPSSAVANPPPKPEGGEVDEPAPDTVGPASDNVATDNELPKYETSSAAVRDTINRGASIETLPACGNSDEAVDTTQHDSGKIEPVTGHGSYDRVVKKTEPQQGKRRTHHMFTAKRISSSISVSENIRMLCSALIALLVVLSYHGYPVGGDAMGSVISFRPIYLVLLTDASIVFGILFTTYWEAKDEADAGSSGQGREDWADQMSKALEALLALQKVASAVFLDCCLCAVVIICGTSFRPIA